MTFDQLKELKDKYKDRKESDVYALLNYIETLHTTVYRAVCILEKVHLVTGSAVGFEVGKEVGKNETIKPLELYD